MVGRFINADGLVSTGQGILGNNMFLYCENNPINRADPSGLFWKEIGNFFISVGKAVANFVTSVISDYNSISLSKSNRKPGKTPPSNWPPLPDNLGGKKPKWNPEGYWQGKEGDLTWDSRSHGAGVDRGDGAQDGHWDDEKSDRRWDRKGNPIISPSKPKIEIKLPELPHFSISPSTGQQSIFSELYSYVESFTNDYQMAWDSQY